LRGFIDEPGDIMEHFSIHVVTRQPLLKDFAQIAHRTPHRGTIGALSL
jgi:hypothetical protein